MNKFADGLFYRKPLSQFPTSGDGEVMELEAEDTLNDAFNKLMTHNHSAAPVWDESQQGYLGFVDLDDALNICYDIDLVGNVGGKGKSDTSESAALKTSGLKLVDLFNKANRLRNPSMRPEWIAFAPKVMMKEVIPVLASQTARRVPVISEETGKITKIVSQSSVVRQLSKALTIVGPNHPSVPQVLSQSPTSHENQLGMKSVISIVEYDEARQAFKRMIDETVSAVAVVEEDGSFVGGISNKDISVVVRGGAAGAAGAANKSKAPPKLYAPMYATPSKALPKFSIAASTVGDTDWLGMPAGMFVSEVRKLHATDGKAYSGDLKVSPTTAYREIVHKLADTGAHRAFLVDESTNKPVGVVTVRDICLLIYEESKKKPPPVPQRSGDLPADES